MPIRGDRGAWSSTAERASRDAVVPPLGRPVEPASILLDLQRTAGNHAVTRLVGGGSARPLLLRVGVLSNPGVPQKGASPEYLKAHALITTFSVQYDRMKSSSNGTGSVLDWLDETLLPLASQRLKEAKAEDARALLARLVKDIDGTKPYWLEEEKTTFETLKTAASKEAAKIKQHADDHPWLMKRWRELDLESQAALEKPTVKRALSGKKVEEARDLFHRLRSSLAAVIGDFGGTKAMPGHLTSLREQLLKRSNEYRVPGGKHHVGKRQPLALEARLNHAAQNHAVYLAQAGSKFSHTGEHGSSAESRILVEEKYSGPTTAENIAHGQKTPDEAIQSWIDSPGHEANLVLPEVAEVGFGCARSESGDIFWVQTFGEPRRA